MEMYRLFEFLEMEDDEDMEEYLNRPLRRPRVLRERPNHFIVWDELDFYRRFRLSKLSASVVLEHIEDRIKHPTNWNNALSATNMLLLALRYYATGSMLITVGDFAGVSKSTASRVVAKVSEAIARLRPQYVKLPETPEEINKIRRRFFEIARFPRVVGALDCTHVKILSPGGEHAEVFRNRKSFFSINVQTISDPTLKIQDIVARWPGSAHDSTIFNNSVVSIKFENGEMDNNLLVGDSGYPCKNYLMTPLQHVHTRAENLYNESLIRTRNCVERSYGVWKRRFPVLALGIRLDLQKVQSIIVATAVLHNIACDNNEFDLPPLDPQIEEMLNFVNNVPQQQVGVVQNLTRRVVIQDYFQNLE